MSETISLPLVKCNAFIGLNDFHQKLQTAYQDALRMKRSIDSTIQIQNSRKRKREEVTPEIYTSIPTNSQIESTIGEAISLPLVKCNAFIGLNDYHEKLQTAYQDALRVKRSIDSTKQIQNSRKRKREEITPESYTSSPSKSNSQIESTIEESIGASTTAHGNSSIDHDNHALVRTKSFIQLDDLDQPSKRQKSIPEEDHSNEEDNKSNEKKLESGTEGRLSKMVKAVQEGTSVSEPSIL